MTPSQVFTCPVCGDSIRTYPNVLVSCSHGLNDSRKPRLMKPALVAASPSRRERLDGDAR